MFYRVEFIILFSTKLTFCMQNTAYHLNILIYSNFFLCVQRFCILHHYFCTLILTFYSSWHTKKSKKKDALSIKRAVESLRFQIDWGLKLLGAEKGDLFHQLAKVEVDFISELNLTQDNSCYQEPRGWSETEFTDRAHT